MYVDARDKIQGLGSFSYMYRCASLPTDDPPLPIAPFILTSSL